MSTVDEIKPAIGSFRAYDFDVVSPALPCGAAWLASCLFEVGIPSWNPWGMNNTEDWLDCSNNSFQYVPGNHGWKTLFPGLYDGRSYVFRTSPLPRFHHSLPGVYPRKVKTILIIRDPRDCLYSSWRRSLSGKTLSTEGFCEFIDSNHQLSSLSVQKYLLNCLYLWRSALETRNTDTYLIIRFEDFKSDPISTFNQVLEFLDVDASPAEINSACLKSSFQQAQKAEQSLDAAFRDPCAVNRAGIAYEYQQAFDKRMHDAIDKGFAPYLDWLGYKPLLS